MVKKIVKFFDKLEDKIYLLLSEKHILYASIGISISAILIFIILFSSTLSQLRILQKREKEAVPAIKYLHGEEAFIVESENVKENPMVIPVDAVLFEYIQVIDSCGPHFDGECLRVRSGPGLNFAVVSRLRNGVVLKVKGSVERENKTWYKIIFDEHIRYPERVRGDWYVSADYVRVLTDEGTKNLSSKQSVATTKRIIVDQSEQMLYAYEGEELFMQELISTGIELSPTPTGTFTIFRKTPSRYMQGPLPGISRDYWDLPGVPWNLYFSQGGAVIHGTYWHNNFGRPASHGCVNIPPEPAETLYKWADLGTKVTIRN